MVKGAQFSEPGLVEKQELLAVGVLAQLACFVRCDAVRVEVCRGRFADGCWVRVVVVCQEQNGANERCDF